MLKLLIMFVHKVPARISFQIIRCWKNWAHHKGTVHCGWWSSSGVPKATCRRCWWCRLLVWPESLELGTINYTDADIWPLSSVVSPMSRCWGTGTVLLSFDFWTVHEEKQEIGLSLWELCCEEVRMGPCKCEDYSLAPRTHDRTANHYSVCLEGRDILETHGTT